MTPSRPALRYMGGKWRIAPWIIDHFPAHRTYVEPFGGAASVLLRKPRSYAEIYNDRDEVVVKFFTVLRQPEDCARLVTALELTPFARAEFDLSYEPSDDPVEEARRLVVRSFMGHGATAIALRRRTGFRSGVFRQGTTPAHDWMRLPRGIAEVAERMRGVVIENRPALEVIERYDRSDSLIYLDPPYVHTTRSQKARGGSLEHAYAHEMSEQDHAELLQRLRRCNAMVLVSGYACSLYDAELAGWDRVERETHADGARPRTEVLWINAAARDATGLLGRFDHGRQETAARGAILGQGARGRAGRVLALDRRDGW